MPKAMSQPGQIYLDNAATTRVDPGVADLVYQCMCETFGNPSSAHSFGIEAERIIKTATVQLAKAIGDEHQQHGRAYNQGSCVLLGQLFASVDLAALGISVTRRLT